MRKFDFDLESTSCFLSCAIDNLTLLRDGIYQDLFAMEEQKKYMGTGHMQACCDAMTTTFHELERIKEEMDAAIEAEYSEGD